MSAMRFLAALFAPLALASTAVAQFTVPVTLSGGQENPANSSSASGSGSFTLNGDNTVSFSISYTGISSGASVAHIHGSTTPGTGLPGSNAGVLLDIAPFHVGTLAGSTSGQFTAANVVVNASFLQALELGQTYFNIHSTSFGGGEIRGQIAAIPEPSTVGLLAVVLAGALVYRRRH